MYRQCRLNLAHGYDQRDLATIGGLAKDTAIDGEQTVLEIEMNGFWKFHFRHGSGLGAGINGTHEPPD